MIEKILNNIFKSADIDQARRAIYNKLLYTNIKFPKIIPIKILILCVPCHGFGDVIFGSKIKHYIKEWYGIDARVATTTPELFEKIGEPKKDIITLKGLRGKQCRRFSNLDATIGVYDLILVAPLMADSEISYRDVKNLISYSTSTNTFFFSEYNDRLDKGFDINTGIGKGRDGLLFVNAKSAKSDIEKFGLSKSYALAYLAETIDDSDLCFLRFVRMVMKKYPKLEQIVCPTWIENINPEMIENYVKADTIIIKTQKEDIIIKQNGGRTIVFRCDVLPVSNKIMLSIIHYSVNDILLTGDQSITDALSCCPRKNIFYQIAPWKEDFGKNLAKYMPNKFLENNSTSCGTKRALNYKSNYKKFVKTWDFRKLGKVKVDAMVASALLIKNDKDFAYIVKILNESKTINSAIHKIEKIAESY
jgi:hypothetical protein